MVNQQDRDVPLVCKLFRKPDVLIVICVQIAVTACARTRCKVSITTSFVLGMLGQKLLDLLFQPVLERVGHDRKVQRRRRIFRQVKEPRLDTLERIFEAEIQNFALRRCKIPERLPLRNA